MKEDQRAQLNAHLAKWRQGDCALGDLWIAHRVDPKLPLTEEALAAAREDVDLTESAVAGLCVVSQTCDIVRDCLHQPFVEVVPLVEVDDAGLRSISRGHHPSKAFVPGLAERRLVADLSRVMTVEKSVLLHWAKIEGCRGDDESRSFALALARQRARFAFPDDFTEFAGRLRDRLKEKHDKQSPEGRALRELREIRVRAAVELTFWFIREEDQITFEGDTWATWCEKWLSFVQPTGRFGVVQGLVVTLRDLTARDYVESDPLDLDYLTYRGDA